MSRGVVVGASGNIGSCAGRHLAADGSEVVGVSRRVPREADDASWQSCDIGEMNARVRLAEIFSGAAAVVHAAWEIQPGRDLEQLYRTNVAGSQNVIDAAVAAGVDTVVYVSSVGAYSPGPKEAVDESWPTEGIPTSTYARHKAAVERMLDQLESDHPEIRVVRFRPGLVFQRGAASEIARYFLGPYVPQSAIRRRLIPLVPSFSRLVFQVVHADDVGRAIARAVADPDARGAFNLAADPVLDASRLASLLHAKKVPVPFQLIRVAANAAFRARLTPTDAGWLDMAAAVPVMSTRRAREELGWVPTRSSEEALLELLDGMQDGAGAATPPLAAAPDATGRLSEAAHAAMQGGPGSANLSSSHRH
jgi:nucleoside-diphosphate-sugar epimerase